MWNKANFASQKSHKNAFDGQVIKSKGGRGIWNLNSYVEEGILADTTILSPAGQVALAEMLSRYTQGFLTHWSKMVHHRCAQESNLIRCGS